MALHEYMQKDFSLCLRFTILNSYILSMSGLERKAFDNKHVTFEEHIRTEHNMWHYLYFVVLIKVKDPTQFTGPESYVHEMVKVRMAEKIELIRRAEQWIQYRFAIFRKVDAAV